MVKVMNSTSQVKAMQGELMQPVTNSVLEVIRSIPAGTVSTYGAIAIEAGMPGGPAGARQVSRILASMSKAHALPWWRVVRKDGSIAMPEGNGLELQRSLLESEGVEFGLDGRIDLGRYSTWRERA
jgi:methylated-DNA-protein-cysteine methyltransferase-like protein